jgi:branched-chain amino acid transport system permease protein
MQIFFNGLTQGLLIALAAMGFSIVYNSTGILHISQGAIYALSPFLLLSLKHAGFSVSIAVLCTFVAVILLSVLIEKFNHWPLYKKGASPQSHFISSLGIYIVIVQLIVIIWGNETKTMRDQVDTVYKFIDLSVTASQVLAGVVSVVSILFYFIWLKKTQRGLKLIALSENPIQLSLMGYDIGLLRLLAFGMSGLFTMLSSVLTAVDVGFDPYGGLKVVLLAIVATIIGGKGSFVGPVIGGIFLGILKSQVVWYTSARWEEAFSLIILVFFLFFWPQGFLGDKRRIEAQ